MQISLLSKQTGSLKWYFTNSVNWFPLRFKKKKKTLNAQHLLSSRKEDCPCLTYTENLHSREKRKDCKGNWKTIWETNRKDDGMQRVERNSLSNSLKSPESLECSRQDWGPTKLSGNRSTPPSEAVRAGHDPPVCNGPYYFSSLPFLQYYLLPSKFQIFTYIKPKPEENKSSVISVIFMSIWTMVKHLPLG